MQRVLLGLFLMGSVSAVASTNLNSPTSREIEANEMITKLITEDIDDLKLPARGKLYFYTLCNTFEFQLIIGGEEGRCVAFSLNSIGSIEYVPINIWVAILGFGGSVSSHQLDLHRIKGVDSLDEIAGLYLSAISGVSVVSNARVNWFTLKLTIFDIVGNTPEGDTTVKSGYGCASFSVTIFHYSKSVGRKQFLSLSSLTK